MTFSNLWPLAFLIFIPVIILLYLLKQKVKDQPFSSAILWQEIYKNLEAKTPFEKLKHNILMYLQIIAMLILILALMAPVIRNGGIVTRNTVLVIDTSASMGTICNGGMTRLDEGISGAKNYLDGVNDSGIVTIVACDNEAHIVYQGQDKSIAKKRLGELEPVQVSGTLDVASGIIGSLVSNMDNVDVVCYTDSEFDYESFKRNNDKISLSVESIYSKEENLSVDYVNYAIKDSVFIEAICKVTNHGTGKATTDVSLYLDKDIADVQNVTVEAEESKIVYFKKVKLPENVIKNGLILRAELSEKDSLIADNISSIAVSSNDNRKVLLISEGNVFLEKSLSLVDGAEVYKAEGLNVLGEADDFNLYVFDGISIPDDFDASTVPDNAAYLIINYDYIPSFVTASGNTETNETNILKSNANVTDCMLHFEKSDVTGYVEDYTFGVTEAYTYQLPQWANAIIAAGEGNVVGYYGDTGTHRMGVIGFDIHNTDLALQTEFPVFMSQLTEYLLTGDGIQSEINNFPIDESDVIPIENVSKNGILDKTKTGGRAIRNLLLILAIVILIIEGIIYHLQVHSGKKKQFLVIRGILLACIILAISGVSITKKQRKVETIFLVDVSDSMSGNLAAVEKYLKDNMALMPKKNQAGIVLFGKNTVVEQFMTDSKAFYGLNAAPITTATNIENGVTSACSMFRDGVTKRLVLITDGCENEGSISLAASNMKNKDVELYVIPLNDSVSKNSEVYIDSLETPSVIHAGDHYNIAVSVKSNVETDAILSLYSGRVSKGQKEIHLTKGSNQFVFEDVGEEGTIEQYKAVIEPDEDTISVNNTYVTFSQIESKPRVLIVEGKPGNTEEFEKILTAINIDFDKVTASGVPVSLSQLNEYKAVITVDVHYDDLRRDFAKTLETYVKDYSGGYICIGGDNSYALGGYRDTELSEILPVDMDIEGEKEIPKMAMVMVIDQSGSMTSPSEEDSSVTGLELAKQAAISGVNELRETDEAGVLAFDDKYNWTVPISKVNDADEIADKIRTIGEGGGTSIYPALEEAYARILKSDAGIKHIILLTDGQDDFRDYNVLLDQINNAGITVSTVAVGSGSDKVMLSSIAGICGGRFYYTDVNNSIPRIFAKEVYLSTNNYLINEEFYPVINGDNEMLSGVMDDGCPALFGYIAARAKPRADVILESPKGDPILSTWQCGLGRTVAWNSDATNEWTAAFGTWDNYPMLWSNIIHYVISDTDLSGDDLEIVNEGNLAKIIYETEEYDKDTVVSAVISDEKGGTEEITLDPIKPGSYQADITSDEIGIYNLSIRKKNGEETVKSYNTAYAKQYSPEYQFSENEGMLAQFVQQMDGTELSFEDDIWKSNAKRVSSKVPLSMFFIVLSMGLLMFDIIIRRFSLDVAGKIKEYALRGSVRFKDIFNGRREKTVVEKMTNKEDMNESGIIHNNVKNERNSGNNERVKVRSSVKKTDHSNKVTQTETPDKLDMNVLLKKKKERDL